MDDKQINANDSTDESKQDQPKTPPESADCSEQEQLWEAYRLQQQRRACPGCGEQPFLG